MSNKLLELSPLGHTWIFDLDGTLVKHNGYKTDGHDSLLPGVKNFFEQLPEEDFVLIATSRKSEYAVETEAFLKGNGIRFDSIVYGIPYGERLLVNDEKPSGLKTAFAINTRRDQFMETTFKINNEM